MFLRGWISALKEVFICEWTHLVWAFPRPGHFLVCWKKIPNLILLTRYSERASTIISTAWQLCPVPLRWHFVTETYTTLFQTFLLLPQMKSFLVLSSLLRYCIICCLCRVAKCGLVASSVLFSWMAVGKLFIYLFSWKTFSFDAGGWLWDVNDTTVGFFGIEEKDLPENMSTEMPAG